MAANSSSRLIASLGKRVVKEIRVRDSTQLSAASLTPISRAAHYSVYDKNPDEHIRPSFVPDEMMTEQPEKHWAPNPRTGVFGPEAGRASAQGGETKCVNGGEASVLEEKVWYRPTHIEDLERPHVT